ncbi:phosphopantetheine-binding protein [Pseudomonas agarici]|uniref:Phosphopantetheine-binding protein n=1 Tax=Pseudomonas agarici TaxID=46677 RepID=A0A0X1T499_PSEAA|nr:acyl carrier protein [Pseudomonas agarici]AMB86699.1 phosphopantetheine-binding protein [Pseudomonas agarici]
MAVYESISIEKDTIVQWCKNQIGELLNAPGINIDENKDFSELGLDSSLAVSLLIEIEQKFGIEISAEELFDNPNIAAVTGLIIDGDRKAKK